MNNYFLQYLLEKNNRGNNNGNNNNNNNNANVKGGLAIGEKRARVVFWLIKAIRECALLGQEHPQYGKSVVTFDFDSNNMTINSPGPGGPGAVVSNEYSVQLYNIFLDVMPHYQKLELWMEEDPNNSLSNEKFKFYPQNPNEYMYVEGEITNGENLIYNGVTYKMSIESSVTKETFNKQRNLY